MRAGWLLDAAQAASAHKAARLALTLALEMKARDGEVQDLIVLPRALAASGEVHEAIPTLTKAWALSREANLDGHMRETARDLERHAGGGGAP